MRKKAKNPQRKDINHKTRKQSRNLKYRRIVLKLSGELLGSKGKIFEKKTVEYITRQILAVNSLGVKVGVVVGGGNIIRGRDSQWMDKVDADICGMIATMINGIVMYSKLREKNIVAKLCSGIEVCGIVNSCNKLEDWRSYILGEVLLFVGGTGNPFFTTDTAAALRSAEFGADILIKGTKVEGVYSADPKKDCKAIFYRRLNFDEVLEKKLEVMDMAAFNICKEANIPICVYNFMKYPLIKIIRGKEIGTLVTNGGKK